MSSGYTRYFKDPFNDYLATIYSLQLVYGVARTTFIARALSVKLAIVSKVLDRIGKNGFVEKNILSVVLTREGLARAKDIVCRHCILEVSLHNYLGFDLPRSHELFHRMEHLSEGVIEAIYRKLGSLNFVII